MKKSKEYMKIQKKNIIILSTAIATLIVIIAVAAFYVVSQTRMNASMQNNQIGPNMSSMSYLQFASVKGEDYDRSFIANMIVHHQGAIDMAKLALTNANRQELKSLASEIISAQEKEISQMLDWQKEWGFPSTSQDNMVDHSAMGAMADMSSMNAKIQDKTGDEFDRLFIEQMIIHHQSALDMSAPGFENAQRQEVKDLTVEIIQAQTAEIAQLKKWQQEWGL